MYSVFVLQIFLLVTITVVTSAKIYTDCGSRANVTEFSVTGCNSPPCIIAKGKSYQVKISAVGASETKSLPYKVTAKLYLVPITLLKGNACTELEAGTCPVEPGKSFSYEHRITIPKKTPSIKTKIKVFVVDDKGNSVICALLNVKLK